MLAKLKSLISPVPVATIAFVKSVLASVYNLFPLGGANGGIVVRQKGGVAGTNEVQIYHDGTNVVALNKSTGNGSFLIVQNKQGQLTVYNVSGNTIFELNGSVGIRMLSTLYLSWNAGASDAWSGIDTTLYRVAPGVLGAYGSTNAAKGWFQNPAGRARNTADVTNATATMANLADLTITLIAGRKYTGRMSVKCVNSVAAEGIAFDFNGGTATMTSFAAGAGVLASGGTDTVGVNVSTALATALTFTTLTGETWITIELSMVCNAAGIFVPRFAENTSTIGTATVRLGSYLWLEDSPN